MSDIRALIKAVRPLEWQDWSARHRISATARSPSGTFRITQRHFPEMFFCLERPDSVPVTSATFESAKAAAQSDYAERILSALTDEALAALRAKLEGE
jgi:hypothetical protein